MSKSYIHLDSIYTVPCSLGSLASGQHCQNGHEAVGQAELDASWLVVQSVEMDDHDVLFPWHIREVAA
jgi:hypothetical protein